MRVFVICDAPALWMASQNAIETRRCQAGRAGQKPQSPGDQARSSSEGSSEEESSRPRRCSRSCVRCPRNRCGRAAVPVPLQLAMANAIPMLAEAVIFEQHITAARDGECHDYRWDRAAGCQTASGGSIIRAARSCRIDRLFGSWETPTRAKKPKSSVGVALAMCSKSPLNLSACS